MIFNQARIPRFSLGPTLVVLALVAACGSSDDDSSPTASRTASFAISSATLSVGGQVVNGMTLSRGHGQGASTRFEARMVDLQGQPVTGPTVRVRYQRPQGMGMMNSSGTMMLYDDGTHGDLVPGDGLYCYEDWAGDYGCHTASSPMGQYHYEFWGEDDAGRQCDPLTATVTIN
jgi:hypothetical protein